MLPHSTSGGWVECADVPCCVTGYGLLACLYHLDPLGPILEPSPTYNPWVELHLPVDICYVSCAHEIQNGV